MSQVRPRLTENELRFILDSLKHMLAVVEHRERQFKELTSKVYRLKKELRYNTMVWKELKEAKQQLSDMGNFEAAAIKYRYVINCLFRRFEALLKGGKLHTNSFAEYCLSQIYLEPKTLEKF